MIGDRRAEPRRDASELVELRWQDAAGAEQCCVGRMLDLSRSGARLQLARSLCLGAIVELAARERRLSAQVRFCIRAGEEYIVGVEFPESPGILG